jgi:hypothetical protein
VYVWVSWTFSPFPKVFSLFFAKTDFYRGDSLAWQPLFLPFSMYFLFCKRTFGPCRSQRKRYVPERTHNFSMVVEYCACVYGCDDGYCVSPPDFSTGFAGCGKKVLRLRFLSFHIKFWLLLVFLFFGYPNSSQTDGIEWDR